MFDFDVGKLLIFGVVALAVIPPKDLPRVMRTVGQTVGKMRRMASEFQNQFMDAMREADLESVKKELNALNDAAKVDVSFDPATAMRDEMTSAVHGKTEIGASEVSLTPTPAESETPVIPTIAAEPVTPAPAIGEAAPASEIGAPPVARAVEREAVAVSPGAAE